MKKDFEDSGQTQGRRGRPRGWNDPAAQNTNKSLDRAMEVLEHLSALPGATLTQISGDLDQSAATVYRVLITLEQRGIVEFDAAAQTWHIGAQAFVIGARYLRRTSLMERARPVLRALMERTGETANMGVAKGGSVLFLGQVETHATIRAFFPPGTVSPMHASGIGKALMAYMPPDKLDELLQAPRERFTSRTLVDVPELVSELERIRTYGVALDDEEKTPGMRCIAAPVFDMNSEAVAGISVSGPTSRIGPEAVPELGREVLAAARRLSELMGANLGPHNQKANT